MKQSPHFQTSLYELNELNDDTVTYLWHLYHELNDKGEEPRQVWCHDIAAEHRVLTGKQLNVEKVDKVFQFWPWWILNATMSTTAIHYIVHQPLKVLPSIVKFTNSLV